MLPSSTQLRSGEPAEGSACGTRPPRDYTAGEVPDLEFPDGRRRTLTAILQLNPDLFSVKLDPTSLALIDQRRDMQEQLRWQTERFGKPRADDVSESKLYDIDAATVVLYLMVRALSWSWL